MGDRRSFLKFLSAIPALPLLKSEEIENNSFPESEVPIKKPEAEFYFSAPAWLKEPARWALLSPELEMFAEGEISANQTITFSHHPGECYLAVVSAREALYERHFVGATQREVPLRWIQDRCYTNP